VLVGALDWARLILREDARNTRNDGDVDHLGEVWAVPLAEARLSTFLAADREQSGDADEGPEAFLSGTIDDAQARYNLMNVIEPKEPAAAEERVLLRLASQVGLSTALVQRWITELRAAYHASPDADDAPLSPRRLEQLAWFGVDAEARAQLEPLLVLLPMKTPVNLNTASREVIAALIDGMDLATAGRIVESRKSRPCKSLDDIKAQLPDALEAGLTGERASCNSRFFIVTGRLRLDERVMEQRSLLRRTDQEVEVLRRERLSSLAEAETSKRVPLLAP
jgi:general secretion pathway protein K